MVPVLDRYRPVALAAAAVLVAIAVLPGATRGSDSARQALFDAGAGNETDSAPTSAPATAAPDGGDAPAGVGGSDVAATPPPPDFSPSSGNSSFSPSGASSSERSAPASVQPTPTSVAPSPGFGAGTDSGSEPDPLRIVVTTYASTTGGTPIPDDTPDDSLPVGTRVGQTDKASYIRLSGEGDRLVLTEVSGGGRGGDFDTSPVQACQILDSGWEGSDEAVAFAEAPEHDPDDCVPVTPQGDGSWSLLLSGFADPADDRGFALLPSDDPPLDFQVDFAARASG